MRLTTGISGEIAKKVGGLINTLANNKQILCNTFISSCCSSRQSISYYKKTQEERHFQI